MRHTEPNERARRADVCCWHLSDIARARIDVRFWANRTLSRHRQMPECDPDRTFAIEAKTTGIGHREFDRGSGRLAYR
jgi:hypothetical protein